mmetsp:Transcript_4862/g.13563  ORF Transcript_4862/g.13563 Transcript_4862/m.13563 type:complete len:323 (-) Transcript_4862:437-1405(-)
MKRFILFPLEGASFTWGYCCRMSFAVPGPKWRRPVGFSPRCCWLTSRSGESISVPYGRGLETGVPISEVGTALTPCISRHVMSSCTAFTFLTVPVAVGRRGPASSWLPLLEALLVMEGTVDSPGEADKGWLLPCTGSARNCLLACTSCCLVVGNALLTTAVISVVYARSVRDGCEAKDSARDAERLLPILASPDHPPGSAADAGTSAVLDLFLALPRENCASKSKEIFLPRAFMVPTPSFSSTAWPDERTLPSTWRSTLTHMKMVSLPSPWLKRIASLEKFISSTDSMCQPLLMLDASVAPGPHCSACARAYESSSTNIGRS